MQLATHIPRLGAAAVAVIGIAASAHSAQAANPQKCHQGAPEVIRLPGKPDVEVANQTCITAFPQGDKVFTFVASVHTTWKPASAGSIGNRFDAYAVQARLEFNPQNPDLVLETRDCDITRQINAAPQGEYTCETPISDAFVEVDPAFSGDGKVVYDVDGDGAGATTRQLHGTGLL